MKIKELILEGSLKELSPKDHQDIMVGMKHPKFGKMMWGDLGSEKIVVLGVDTEESDPSEYVDQITVAKDDPYHGASKVKKFPDTKDGYEKAIAYAKTLVWRGQDRPDW